MVGSDRVARLILMAALLLGSRSLWSWGSFYSCAEISAAMGGCSSSLPVRHTPKTLLFTS